MADPQKVKAYVYKDPARLTRITLVAIYVLAGLEAVSLLSGLFDISLLQSGPVAGDGNLVRQGLVQLLSGIAVIVTGIITLMWIYRACANAHALTPHPMEFTPGWAVGWNFVPVATLWKPFQAMREIWNVSRNPGAATEDTPVIMRWWWGLWIVDNIAAQASFRLTGVSGDETLASAAFDIISNAADIGACVFLMMLIWQITVWQTSAGTAEAVFA